MPTTTKPSQFYFVQIWFSFHTFKVNITMLLPYLVAPQDTFTLTIFIYTINTDQNR